MREQSDPEEWVRVIVGLGNPGRRYERARHNIGFQVIDRLAERCSIRLTQKGANFLWGRGNIAGHEVYSLKPLTYMNRSGEAVREFLEELDLFSAQILVIHDDLDLPTGRLKVMRKGGAGGHRGVASIIAHLEHQDFFRIKLGIGRPMHQETVEEFVLDDPYPEEVETYLSSLEAGVEAVCLVMEEGVTAAMNKLNGRKPESALSSPGA
jgi:PTH1 family peptidyl-tRNA hydrolase